MLMKSLKIWLVWTFCFLSPIIGHAENSASAPTQCQCPWYSLACELACKEKCSVQASTATLHWYLTILPWHRPCLLREHGDRPAISTDITKELIAIGNSSNRGWAVNFLKKYFGRFYDPTLTDWVVFINSTGAIHEELVDWSSQTGHAHVRAKDSKTQILEGDSHVWVVVFSRKPFSSATIHVDQLERYRGPGERAIDAIARSFPPGIAPAGNGNKSISDSVAAYDRTVIFSSNSTPGLYTGFLMVPLKSNTRNRIEIERFHSKDGSQFPHSIVTNFVNAEKGRFGASLVGGGTTSSGHFQPNVFIAAHYYFSNYPSWTGSWWQHTSLFAGTNLAKPTPLSEFLVGFGICNFAFLPRSIGLDIAADVTESTNIKGSRLFLGIDYRL